MKDNLYSITQKIINRISERKELAPLASEFSEPIDRLLSRKEDDFFISEEGVGTTCGGPGTAPGKKFYCSRQFACLTAKPYDCTNEIRSYSDCGGGGYFACSQTQKTPFNCDSNYFDCTIYACGLTATETFDCNSHVDFNCGADVRCVGDFDCTAGHGFFCFAQHSCQLDFTCEGGTTCTENKGGTKECNATHKYNMPGGDPNDPNTNPGDFMCSKPDDSYDAFNCGSQFNCNANSDFSCHDKSQFKCAQQSGDKKFDCKKIFACREAFECKSAEQFNCAEKPSYNCPKSYALCPNANEKNCSEYYTCLTQNNCKSENDFECGAFSCSLKVSYSLCVSNTQKECHNNFICPQPNNCVSPGFKCTSPTPYGGGGGGGGS